jgi:hypothetical protein
MSAALLRRRAECRGVSDLREPWVTHADAVLADEEIDTAVTGPGETTSEPQSRAAKHTRRGGFALADS